MCCDLHADPLVAWFDFHRLLSAAVVALTEMMTVAAADVLVIADVMAVVVFAVAVAVVAAELDEGIVVLAAVDPVVVADAFGANGTFVPHVSVAAADAVHAVEGSASAVAAAGGEVGATVVAPVGVTVVAGAAE